MADSSLILARDIVQHTAEGTRIITAGVRGDGVYLFDTTLLLQAPPDMSHLFIKIRPPDIIPSFFSQLFNENDAIEICAVYNFNRQKFLNVVKR